MKIKNIQQIEVNDWDTLVEETYGRKYSFQQQEGCKDRGIFNLTIPSPDNDNEMNEEIPEEVNGETMGVKFNIWLARDPKQRIKDQTADYELDLFWQRNFYPDIQMVANDLLQKGLIESGKYQINIDW